MTALNATKLNQIIPMGAKEDPANAKNSRYPYLLGVELELENVRWDEDEVPDGWVTHVDESLRNGIEFVFRSPKAGSDMLGVVDNFFAAGIKWNNSPRTSTHIHVNAGDLTVEQLRSMYVLTYIVEDALFQTIAKTRKYCGYCMSLYEMPPIRARNILGTLSPNTLVQSMGGPNAEKYYGFNINSARKHGTVEFRYFPGGPSKEELLGWINYCTDVKAIALKYSLDSILGIQDEQSLVNFLLENLGDWGRKFVDAVGPTALFDNLQEVVGLFPYEEEMNRQDNLIFVNPPLLKAVKDILFPKSDVGYKFFEKEVKKLGVMTFESWWGCKEQADEAMYREANEVPKPQPKKLVMKPGLEWVEPQAMPDWAMPAQELPPDPEVQARRERQHEQLMQNLRQYQARQRLADAERLAQVQAGRPPRAPRPARPVIQAEPHLHPLFDEDQV